VVGARIVSPRDHAGTIGSNGATFGKT